MSSGFLGLQHGSGSLWGFCELVLHGPATGLLEDGCVATGVTGRKEGSATRCVCGILKTANSRLKVVIFFLH